jgi:Skp family chaperone for outer membrane proteins
VGALAFASPVIAQNTGPILTIDQDRLFSETRLGTETLGELETQAQELAAENQEIENALIAEELELTEKRSELEPETFRALANAFDERVQMLRAEQDEKGRQLNRLREDAQGQFLRDSAGIISEIVRARGALLVIDRRDVFLSADSIDITEEAIRRINEAESE